MQSLANRAAHEIRNPLNGLALNLEVVRSRAARGTGDLASIGRYADSASSESERAAELVQALLELARPLTEPVDLWSALRPMVVLHSAIAAAEALGAPRDDGDRSAHEVTLEPRGDAWLTVAADPIVSRLALGTALDAAAKARTPAIVRCSVEARAAGDGKTGGQVVAMLRCAAPAPKLDAAVRDAIEGGGVVLEAVPDGMMLTFRAAGRD
ncbi:MAG TPA: histidine kinase dimerization/phospho-acceptor domain-containing protein [Gemmatimonadaceae bacterium]|nr:histidine kinase dimerization/phospho-acceptor domain-containing protein [Gemmatimonadaceae bacterium]